MATNCVDSFENHFFKASIQLSNLTTFMNYNYNHINNQIRVCIVFLFVLINQIKSSN